MLLGGLWVPAHLRAVEVSVIERAGRGTPVVVDRGLALVNEKQLGAAQLLAQAAAQQGIPGHEKLGGAVAALLKQYPAWLTWGGPEPRFENVFDQRAPQAFTTSEPFTEYVIRLANRDAVLAFLKSSQRAAIQQLLRTRALTNTVIFPPSSSSSGQAYDAALAICGLLLDSGRISLSLSNAVYTLADQANRGGNPEKFEEFLLDVMSLGQRLNWGQLGTFMQPIQEPETLRRLAHLVRRSDVRLASLFTAVQLTGDPAGIAKYLMNFGETGQTDLGISLRYGAGGVHELLRRNQRLCGPVLERHQPAALARSLPQFAWLQPSPALAVKWFLYLAGGFLFAMALHVVRPAVSALEQPLQVRGFHVAREILFALGFLLVVLLLSEPFLSQESQKVDFPFRLRLPTVGSLVPPVTTNAPSSIMNQLSLMTLLLFFVLQALLYTASLVKLAEIRRQRVPARIRLRLLENEEHLFDAGLYLGFVGTIISLILVSLGVIKPSLMAAYSSTSFGIIFVSIFKILHLRPARRKILLEAEAAAETDTPSARSTLAVSP